VNLSVNQGIAFFLAALLLVGLMISPFLNGLSQLAILILLLFSLPKSLLPFLHDKKIQLFTLFFFIHILSFFYSNNISYALKDLRIKSVFLLFPFLFAVFGKINHRAYIQLLWILTLGAVLAAIIGVYKYVQNSTLDWRHYSVFISHIRFSYVIATIILLHLWEMMMNKKFYRLPKLMLLTFLFAYLLFLSSLSAIFSIFFTGVFIFGSYLNNVKSKILMAFLFSIPLFFALHVLLDYLPNESFEQQIKKNQLVGNENYYLRVKAKENGYYIGINLNELEIQGNWHKISGLSGDSLKTSISLVLRYLTSKGLSKDSAGLASLSQNDIQNIKSGMSNYKFAKKNNFYKRLYIFYWELDRFWHGESPAGHSSTERLVFWNAAIHIIAQNPIFGVGIGDLPDAFSGYYRHEMPLWPEKYRKKTHNQFLSFLVGNGILGGSIIIVALYLPFFLYHKKNIPLKMIIVLMSISMLTEDTFETQAGATFFAFFYSLFIYADFENQELSS